MPVYLFTFHGYAKWMPDRRQGYVHHQRGLQPRSVSMATAYRRQQRECEACFNAPAQAIIAEVLHEAADHLRFTLHAFTIDPSHIHLLISWNHERDWQPMRRSIKTSVSRALNHNLTRRTWLSKGASRKRVTDRAHFDYLLLDYLPRHRGTNWFRDRDLQAARKRAAQ